MGWTAEERLQEALAAPIGSHLGRETTVIERPGWYQIVTPTARRGGSNEVVLSHLREDEADRVIDEVIAQYTAHGLTTFKWCVYPDATPADLAARLERRGLKGWDVRAMTCDTAAEPLALKPGVTVEKVEGDTLREYCSVLAGGWDMDADQELARHRTAGPDRRFFLARHDGQPAGVAGFVEKARSVYLFGAVVLPAFRGRGLYAALIDARLRSAAALGKTLATTQAREQTSAPILERLGFETVARFRVYSPG